jgi:predicted Na+-dependent transporter
VACWFIYHALNQLGYLYDYNFLEFAGNHKYEEIIKAYKDSNQPLGLRISMDLVYAASAGLAAILIVFVISLALSIKHK